MTNILQTSFMDLFTVMAIHALDCEKLLYFFCDQLSVRWIKDETHQHLNKLFLKFCRGLWRIWTYSHIYSRPFEKVGDGMTLPLHPWQGTAAVQQDYFAPKELFPTFHIPSFSNGFTAQWWRTHHLEIVYKDNFYLRINLRNLKLDL